jgi:hypothetical protein
MEIPELHIPNGFLSGAGEGDDWRQSGQRVLIGGHFALITLPALAQWTVHHMGTEEFFVVLDERQVSVDGCAGSNHAR